MNDIIEINEDNCSEYGKLFLPRSINSIELINENNNVAIVNNSNFLLFSNTENILYNFEIEKRENKLKMTDKSIKIFGKVDEKNEYRFLIDEVENSICNSVCIYSTGGDPFLMLLGTTPSNLKIFSFTGKEGIHLYSNIWFSKPIVYYEGKILFGIKENIAKNRIRMKVDYIIEYA